MTFAYTRGRWLVHAVLTDVLLLAVWAVALRSDGALWRALSIAIPAVFGWNVMTVHHPRAIDVDDDGVTFHAYGRMHRYAWRDVTRLSVRRFLVRDRVLVRIAPAPAFGGRYWIVDGIEGFERLVTALESHRKT